MAQWISVWSQAHADMSLLCKNVKNHTARLSFVSQAGGSRIRFRLSNQEGKRDVCITAAAVRFGAAPPVILRTAGNQVIRIRPGEWIYTDPADAEVSAGDILTVSLAFQGTATSGNILPEAIRYSTPGNYAASIQMPLAKNGLIEKIFGLDLVTPVLSSAELYTEERPEVLVCFGDSITQMSRWTKPLADHLRYSGKNIIIINKGIGGNQLLSDPETANTALYGVSGRKRFDKDVLELTGATALLIAIGVNDLNGAKNASASSGMSERLKKGYLEMADKARTCGLKVYAATVTPSSGCKGYQPASEDERRKLNDWLRRTDAFDGIADFDLAVRDPENPIVLDELCDSGDHIHPGVIGGEKMASVVYSLLTGSIPS